MSWDEKDWHYITFWSEGEDTAKKASKEYDGVDRNYDDYLKKAVSIYECSRDLYPLDKEELQKLQNISNKYSILITYWYCGQGTIHIKPQKEE